MSELHKDCGKEIRWANRSDDPDRFFPPLEYAGEYFIISEDNAAILVHAYKRHECNPKDMKAWLELKREQAEIRGVGVEDIDTMVAKRAQHEQEMDEYNTYASQVKCASCKATVGEMCFNMSALKRGNKTYNKRVHRQRYEDAVRKYG